MSAMPLKTLIILLSIIITGCQTPMHQGDFPSRFYSPNPILGDPLVGQSMYLSDNTFLEAEKDRIDSKYALFYASIDTNLSRLSSATRNQALAAWISALTSTTKLLEVHHNDYFNQQEPRFPNNLI